MIKAWLLRRHSEAHAMTTNVGSAQVAAVALAKTYDEVCDESDGHVWEVRTRDDDGNLRDWKITKRVYVEYLSQDLGPVTT